MLWLFLSIGCDMLILQRCSTMFLSTKDKAFYREVLLYNFRKRGTPLKCPCIYFGYTVWNGDVFK